MDNKRFLSYFITITVVMMLSSIIYIFTLNRSYKVKDYKFTDDMIYSGTIKEDRFNGTGMMKTSDGTYHGSFSDGRFDKSGIFVGEDYTYMAKFDHKNVNSNVTIKLSDGEIYKKINGSWEKVDDEN